MKIHACLLLLFLGATLAQQGKSVDDLIAQVFNNNNNNNAQGTTNPTTSVQPNNENRNQGETGTGGGGGGGIPGTGSCTCVPYYLCNNNSIITDGTGIIDIRIDGAGPCGSYLDTCCSPQEQVEEPITPRPDHNKPKGCGRHNPEGVGFRIQGGVDNEANFGEFPWMVAVLREEAIEGNAQKLSVYQCGGSLIHPKAVITAAHCVIGKDKKFKIRAGEWDTQTKKELFPHQDRDVVRIVTHPQFYSGALFNDIAILFLNEPLEIAENVDVVCLPHQDEVIENTRCFATGWGKDVFGKEGKYQVIMKKIDLPIVARKPCQDALRTTRLGKLFELHTSFICAGGEKGKDTCKGDGGSPLVCPIPGHPGKYQHAGIVAWGIGCGENQVPGVYASVAKFANWIDEQIAYENLDMSYYKY